LELSIEWTETVSGESDGVAVLPARLTTEILRALEASAVELEVKGNEARITAGRSHFEVVTYGAEGFPSFQSAPAPAVTLQAEAFAEALKQVVRAASTDESRQALTGVLLTAEEHGLRMVATDSYRLALRDLAGTSVLAEGQRVLVPARALTELVRLLGSTGELTLRLGEREATFEVGHARLSTRLIEPEFPNYRQLIPSSYPNRLTVGREPLLDAIRRVKLLARESTSSPIRLHLSADGVELVARTQDLGQASEDVDARYEGADMVVAFNPDYLAAGVEATTGDEVVLETLDALKPAVLRATEGGEFLYLLMPVRVS
jgi:DNA polymerase-3 subunit beta